MSPLAWLVVAIGIFAGGVATGIKWHAGQDAIAAAASRELRDTDMRQQRQLGERKGAEQAAEVRTLSKQLGDARAQIATLSGRPCLDDDTVRVLNAIGADNVRAAAGEPARAASAAGGAAGQRYATDADAARQIAVCRAGYAEVSGQLNKILDIEERRHPPAPGAAQEGPAAAGGGFRLSWPRRASESAP